MHYFIERQNFDCSFALFLGGFDPNSCWPPLILSTLNAANLDIFRMLIVFGADVNLKILESHYLKHYLWEVVRCRFIGASESRLNMLEMIYVLDDLGVSECSICSWWRHFAHKLKHLRGSNSGEKIAEEILRKFLSFRNLKRSIRTSSSLETRNNHGYRILSLDGGGTKGLLSIQVI